MTINEILKDTEYKSEQFSSEAIGNLNARIEEKTDKKGKKIAIIKCLIREKEIVLKPEEVVRQLYIDRLIHEYGYPASRIRVEYPVYFGREVKRADIVIMNEDRPNDPYIVIEVKKPKMKEGKDQLKSYCNSTGAPIAVWTNGDQIAYFNRQDPNYFKEIRDIPSATQTLEDIVSVKWTIQDLKENDRLQRERISLKDVILNLEDEVLANAGVDVFEECFKLIFAKLYDEFLSGQIPTRYLEFSGAGRTDFKLKEIIQGLFNEANQKWKGVFDENTKILLSPSHLSICVASLQSVKLFNSNLDVVDDAFEYLMSKSSKGEKGQFFTPRYVIEMCVRMLNPKEGEKMIDTACGSSGFPVHTILHVWRQMAKKRRLNISEFFSLDHKPYEFTEYVKNNIFGIDFDEKAVRVARTLNLIAGDGHTNVLHLNTLDFTRWDETAKEEDWSITYSEGFNRLKKLRKDNKSFRDFNFDILMANPPFAGDIKESRMLSQYELAKKSKGSYQNKVGRDILFIERNLDFLKPGGRMAIVLPQGRFNNSSDKYIRDYIAERCRILAVVGIHGNVFKPHTGTKTSVLFVQKWDDKLCPKKEDYPIFFATMQKPSKDSSGDKLLLVDPETGIPALDEHGHLIVDHDLYQLSYQKKNGEIVYLKEGIAEAFIEFAKKEGLSFFPMSPSLKPFDKVKYKALMDGLECNEVLISQVRKYEPFRIDSHFQEKQYRGLEKLLSPFTCCPLKDLVAKSIQTGHTPSMDVASYYGGNIAFIKTDNLHDNSIGTVFSDYLTIEGNAEISRTELADYDIITTIIGATEQIIARSAMVTKEYLPANINQNIAQIRIDPQKVAPEYVVTYLNSKYGKKYLIYLSRQTEQFNLNCKEVEKVLVPILKTDMQNRTTELVRKAQDLQSRARLEYQRAEKELNSFLNIYISDNSLVVSTKQYSKSFQQTGRLDAEYYQPKFDMLFDALKEHR